jgi:hypothetical protein
VACRAFSVSDVLGYAPEFEEPERLEYRIGEVLGSHDPRRLREAFAAALTEPWRAYHAAGEVPGHVGEERA